MDNNFNKELIEYLDKQFGDINQKFIEQKKEFNSLQTSVDAYAHRADAYFQEMVMLSHQYNRHEKWIQMLAEKLNVKLEY